MTDNCPHGVPWSEPSHWPEYDHKDAANYRLCNHCPAQLDAARQEIGNLNVSLEMLQEQLNQLLEWCLQNDLRPPGEFQVTRTLEP